MSEPNLPIIAIGAALGVVALVGMIIIERRRNRRLVRRLKVADAEVVKWKRHYTQASHTGALWEREYELELAHSANLEFHLADAVRLRDEALLRVTTQRRAAERMRTDFLAATAQHEAVLFGSIDAQIAALPAGPSTGQMLAITAAPMHSAEGVDS